MTRRLTPVAVLTALAASVALAAPPPPALPCLTRAETEAVVAVVAPAAVTGAAVRCRASLSAGAYLTRAGAALAARLRTQVGAALPAARAAFARIGGIALPPSLIDDATVVSLIDEGVSKEVIDRIGPADCPAIDRLLQQADPLPAANFAGLVAAAFELGGGATGDTDLPFRVCRAPARR